MRASEKPERFKEAQQRRQLKSRLKTNSSVNAAVRLHRFNKAVRFGPIFICSCCHQKRYENEVDVLDNLFEENICRDFPNLMEKCIPKKISIQVFVKESGSVSAGTLPAY